MVDDPDGAAVAVYFAGGVETLAGRLVAMLVPDDTKGEPGPRQRCADTLRTLMDRPRDAYGWGKAAAYAPTADLRWTVEAIRLLAADAGAITLPGVTRWMGDTEAAIELACRQESVEQIAEQQVQYLLDAGLDGGRARYWVTAQDPLLGYLTPLDMIRAGHAKAVEMARVLLVATLPDL